MKRFAKSMLGVTLLEIMLVLAIAAMIIVMSVRYYQSATINQQANAFLSQLQAMQAAADSLAQGSGSYSVVTPSGITSITGGGTNGLNAPWGATITVTSSASVMTYTMTGTTPQAVCSLLKSRMATNANWGITGDCTAFVYTANPA